MPIPVPHPKQIPSKFSPYCGLVCQTAGRVPPVETLRGVKSECFLLPRPLPSHLRCKKSGWRKRADGGRAGKQVSRVRVQAGVAPRELWAVRQPGPIGAQTTFLMALLSGAERLLRQFAQWKCFGFQRAVSKPWFRNVSLKRRQIPS